MTVEKLPSARLDSARRESIGKCHQERGTEPKDLSSCISGGGGDFIRGRGASEWHALAAYQFSSPAFTRLAALVENSKKALRPIERRVVSCHSGLEAANCEREPVVACRRLRGHTRASLTHKHSLAPLAHSLVKLAFLI